MLQMPVQGRTRGRQISIGGSGDTKDKLLMGGLVGIIVIALVALVYHIIGSNKPNVPPPPDKFHIGCLACKYEWDLPRDDFYAAVETQSKGGAWCRLCLNVRSATRRPPSRCSSAPIRSAGNGTGPIPYFRWPACLLKIRLPAPVAAKTSRLDCGCIPGTSLT